MEQMSRSYEETARKYKQGANNFMYALCWVMLVISGFIAVIALQSAINFAEGFNINNIISIVVVVVFGGTAFLLWRNKDNLRVEYDYTFTPIGGGKADLDVAKVLGNARRKLMTSLTLSTVESAGNVNHPSFQRFLTMKDVKKHNWFVNRGAELYYFYFTKNNVKHVIVLEISETMVERVKPGLGFGVWQK